MGIRTRSEALLEEVDAAYKLVVKHEPREDNEIVKEKEG